jgi:hypothetical protein
MAKKLPTNQKNSVKKKIAKLRNVAIKENKQGVCHTVALPFTLKKYLTTKEDLWKTQIFYHAKI